MEHENPDLYLEPQKDEQFVPADLLQGAIVGGTRGVSPARVANKQRGPQYFGWAEMARRATNSSYGACMGANGRYVSPSSLVMRPDAISHMREISAPMNLKVRRSFC